MTYSFECRNQTQTIVHSTSQHNSTWWSDHRAFHQSTQSHLVVRATQFHLVVRSIQFTNHQRSRSGLTANHCRPSCIPPVNTVPHGGQINVHSTSQDSYHMVVRSLHIPPVNTVLHGGQTIMHSTSQHSTTWWSDHRAFHQSTQYHVLVRSSCITPVKTVPRLSLIHI